jgi:hypothetical protein
MNFARIKKIAGKIQFNKAVIDHARILTDAQTALEDSTKTISVVNQPNIWRIIMKSRIIKLAVAAVIVVVVLAGLPFFRGDGAGVALADVLERIEQAQAFIYRMKIAMTGAMMPGMPAGEKIMDGIVTISNSYGMKMEMITTDGTTGRKEMTQQMYVLPNRKAAFILMPEQKKYTRIEFDDDLLARMKKQNNDPREMIKQIMRCKYIELGRSVIDGVKVEGFQTMDTAFAGGAGAMEDVNVILWIDVEKWLPVRAKMDFKLSEQMQVNAVIYDYQWDIPVDAGEFEPIIPEDFTGFPSAGMKMPSMSEEAAIGGLKFFAEILGRYPENVNLMNLMQEFVAIKDSENLTEAGLRFKEEMEQMQTEEDVQKAMDMGRPIQSLGMFYMTLVQDKKEPAYYGHLVGPDDIDMVLMRWKVSDDEYRVIFGDLTAENVSAAELAELEAVQQE